MENQFEWATTLQADETLSTAPDAAQEVSANAGQTITSRRCPRGQTRYAWRTTDTLESVASRYGVLPDAIREANPGVVFTRLNFGDEICIPLSRSVCPNGRLYEIRRGDTFTSIAARLGVPVYMISDMNPYVDPTMLQIGQMICVPESRPETPVAPPGTPPAYPGPGNGAPPPQGCPSNSITIIMPMGWGFGTVLTRYGISFNALQAANPGLNIEAIPAGQRLCIPPAGSRQLCGMGMRSHVIDRGETLDSLARRFGISVSRLLRINADLAPADFIAGRVICAPEQRNT